MLADTNAVGWAAISMSFVEMVVTSVVTVVIWRINRRLDEQAGERRENKETIGQLESRLHDAATKLIDERFRAMSHEVKGHAQGVVTAMDEMKEAFRSTINDIRDRLKSGDGEFDALGERDQKIEIAVVNKFAELKDWMRQLIAEHEKTDAEGFNRVGSRVGELAGEMRMLASKIEPDRHTSVRHGK